jgi:hypothetical protein
VVDDLLLVQVWAAGEPDVASGQEWVVRVAGQAAESAPPRLERLALVRPGVLQIAVVGESGFSHSIEASTDLSHWITLTNLVTTGSNVLISDPDAGAAATRFYRAVTAP